MKAWMIFFNRKPENQQKQGSFFIEMNIFMLCVLLVTPSHVSSQESAQWRGPCRDGVYTSGQILATWPAESPALLWSVSGIGEGYSSAAATGEIVFVTGAKGGVEFLSAISREGRMVWQVAIGPAWTGTHSGSRSTPLVDSNCIYTVTGAGTITCVDASDGSVAWILDAATKFKASSSLHGICESLLLSGDKLFYTPGGKMTTMVALNRFTGATIWTSKSLGDASSYVSPLLLKYGGKTIIVTITSGHLAGINADNGEILWEVNYPVKGFSVEDDKWYASSGINTPLYDNGYLYVSGGYNLGGVMFRINEDASAISPVWRDSTLDCHLGGVVLVKGYIFGSNWIDNRKGNWCCINWQTGRPMYTQRWFTKGSIIAVNDMLCCYEEKGGNLGLVRPDPTKFDLVSSFRIVLGKGPHFAYPSFAKGVLYVRHGDVLIAYDIGQKSVSATNQPWIAK